MTLRTGLLMFLGFLACATLGLYFALSQTGGVGIPGGESALEQALAPYVDEESLNFSEPRIAIVDGADTVEMTLRSLAFTTAAGSADVNLDRIRAVIDSARIAQGAIRFEGAEMARARISIDLGRAESSSADVFPKPQAIVAAIDDAYEAAFAAMRLDRLSKLTINTLYIELMRGGERVASGTGSLTLQPAGKTMQLSSSLVWTGFKLIAFEGKSDVFIMGGEDAPLDIGLNLYADTIDSRLEGAAFKLASTQMDLTYDHRAQADARLAVNWNGQGLSLASDTIFDGAREFAELSAAASYNARSDVLTASTQALPLGAATARVAAELKDASGEGVLTAQAQIAALSTNDLKAYWPRGLSDSGRKWVTDNIETGLIRNASATFIGSLGDIKADRLPAQALSLTFDLENVSAHYVRPMPPLLQAGGTAKMTLDDIFFKIDRGMINGVDASGSTVLITSFSQSPQRGEIALRLNGSSTALAQALDSQPLGYFSTYGLDPDALSGSFSGRALLALPLLKDLPIEDVVLSARIDGQALTLDGLVAGEALQFKRTVIELTQDGMTLRGDIAATDMDAALRWTEDFTGNTSTPTQISLNGQIQPPGIPRWLPAVGNTLFGTIFFDANIQGRGPDITAAAITADLTAAAIDLPVLGYEKPVATAAEAYVSMTSVDDQFVLEAITINGPDLLVIGDGQLARDGSTASILASTIELPALQGTLTLSKEGKAWLLAGDVTSVDLAPTLDMFWAGNLTQSTAPTTEEQAQASDVLSVSLSLSEIRLLSGKSAKATRVLGSFQGTKIRQLNVFGQGPAQAPFTLTIEPVIDGRRFLLASQSAGELANGLGMFSDAQGGQLMVQATSFDRSDSLVLAGLLEMRNVRLLDTPILARLLGLGSLTGVADLARDRGINFETIDIPFELSEGVVSVTNAAAKGPALGLTGNGQFLESLEQGDIRGVIVPSYTINSALGRVPVIGDVLVGGQDTGLFGINYRVSGAMADPDLSVNPASMLTPGFLRGIFGDQKGRLDDVSSAPLTPEVIEQTQ